MTARPPYFEKSVALYNLLKKEANKEGYVEFVQLDAMMALDYPNQYASRLKQVLESLGSVTQIQRGARNRPTIWMLHREPDLEEYNKFAKAGEFDNFTRHLSDSKFQIDMINQQIRTLNERLTIVETNLNALIDAFAGSQGATNPERKVS